MSSAPGSNDGRSMPERGISRKSLAAALPSVDEAREMDAHGTKEAGVLIPIYDHGARPGIVFTERRRDLPRHPGEISFPGGKPHAGEELLDTALRESHEEIALDPGAVDVIGALPPFSTVVTSYKVFPFVGLIADDLRLVPSPDEVERLVELRIDDLHAGFEMQRLVRRGIPFRTPTYTVGDDFIWGATARILQDFLDRLEQTPQ